MVYLKEIWDSLEIGNIWVEKSYKDIYFIKETDKHYLMVYLNSDDFQQYPVQNFLDFTIEDYIISNEKERKKHISQEKAQKFLKMLVK